MTHKVEIMMIDRTLAATPMPSKLKNVPAVIVIQWAEIPRTAKDKTRTRPRNWHWETRLFVKHGGRTEDDATGLMKCHVRHSMARKECKKIRIRSREREREGKQKRRNGQRKKTGMWVRQPSLQFLCSRWLREVRRCKQQSLEMTGTLPYKETLSNCPSTYQGAPAVFFDAGTIFILQTQD